jgi:hypothetical protein
MWALPSPEDFSASAPGRTRAAAPGSNTFHAIDDANSTEAVVAMYQTTGRLRPVGDFHAFGVGRIERSSTKKAVSWTGAEEREEWSLVTALRRGSTVRAGTTIEVIEVVVDLSGAVQPQRVQPPPDRVACLGLLDGSVVFSSIPRNRVKGMILRIVLYRLGRRSRAKRGPTRTMSLDRENGFPISAPGPAGSAR